MNAEGAGQRVDGFAFQAPAGRLGDLVVAESALELHRPWQHRARLSAAEQCREQVDRCGERIAGVRKPSLSAHHLAPAGGAVFDEAIVVLAWGRATRVSPRPVRAG